jgi:outer membrane protein OmpA-like peptidoglycan-associated protein
MKNLIAIVLCFTLIMPACKSWNKTEKGTAIGSGAGAAAGAGIAKLAGKNTIVGAIIGAAVGGVAGAAIGHYMDKQAAEIERDIQGAKVERIGEGIKITFDSGILFDVNSATLKPAAMDNISKLVTILNKYPDTDVRIEGHTDSTGNDQYNQQLSEKRAESVSNYAEMKGIKGARIITIGYGRTQPVESNATPEGRAKNRRVDIAIMANKKLKKAAKKGEIGGESTAKK